MRLELRDITKRFPGVLANDRISISADRGFVPIFHDPKSTDTRFLGVRVTPILLE